MANQLAFSSLSAGAQASAVLCRFRLRFFARQKCEEFHYPLYVDNVSSFRLIFHLAVKLYPNERMEASPGCGGCLSFIKHNQPSVTFKEKIGSIREEFYIEACRSGHYQPKALRRASALTSESTFYRERKGFISREKRFVLTIKNVEDGF